MSDTGFDWRNYGVNLGPGSAAPATPNTPAPTTSAPSGGSSSGFNWGSLGVNLGGGAGPQSGQPAPVAQAGVPGSSHYHGVLGWLDRLGHGAVNAAEAFPAGFAKLSSEIGQTVWNNAQSNAGNRGFKAQSPAFNTLAAPVVQTGRYGAGIGQLAGGAVGANLGTGFEPELKRDFFTNPFAGISNVATTLSMAAPAAGAGLSRVAAALPEDSALGGAAASGARAAGVAGGVAGHVANLPMLPWTIPYEVAAHGLPEGLAGALGHLPGGGRVNQAADAVHQGYQNRQAAATTAIKDVIAQKTGRGDVANAVMRAEQASGGDPVRFGAALAHLENQTGLYGPIAAGALSHPAAAAPIRFGEGFSGRPAPEPALGLTPAEHARAVAEAFATNPDIPLSKQVTPEQAHLAEGLRQGTLAPDVAAQMAEAAKIIREGEANPRQAIEESGSNRLIGAGLNPEQKGFTPLTNVVKERTDPLYAAAAKAETAATKAEAAAASARQKRGSPATGGKVTFDDRTATVLRQKADRLLRAADKAKAAVSESPEAAANRLAPAMYRAQAYADSLRVQAEEAGSAGDYASASRLHQLANQIPTTLSAVRGAHEAGTFDDPVHLISERYAPPKGPGGVKPLTPLTGRAKPGGARQGSRENMLLGTTPATFADTAMRRRAEAEHNANIRLEMKDKGKTSAMVPGVDPKLRGQPLIDAMAATRERWQPFNPASTFTQGRIIDPKQVGPHTVFLPKGYLDAMTRRETVLPIGPHDIVGRMADKITQWLYKKPLSIEPTMVVRHAASSLFKAEANAGVNPLEIAARARQAITEIHNRTYYGRAVQGNGMFGDEKAAVTGVPGKTGVLNKVGDVLTSGRKAANYLNQVVQVAVMLHDHENGMLPEAAAAHAVQTVGIDWGNLDPATRAVTARLFPIVPFIKSVGLAAAKFGVDHPIMQAYINNLGMTASQDPQLQGLPAWLRGALPLGAGKYINLNSLYPPSLLMSAGVPGGFTNPVVKDIASIGFGINANRIGTGDANISRPGGTFGKPLTGRPRQLSQDLYIGLKNNPLGRTYLNQFAPQVARYDTGEPYLGKQGPTVYPGGTSGLERGLSILGTPITSYTPPPAAKTAKNAKAVTKAQTTYQNRLKQFGGQTKLFQLP